ncbi:hypothetical protein AGABI1DRAFT_83711, partial [Agaricus bisporus var. burnettii JB137-S8]
NSHISRWSRLKHVVKNPPIGISEMLWDLNIVEAPSPWNPSSGLTRPRESRIANLILLPRYSMSKS